MNWFERYGIPGAYFLGLVAVWLSVFDSWVWLSNKWTNAHAMATGVAGFAALTFLPIGYTISVLSQQLYLRYGSILCLLFWGRGVHAYAVRNDENGELLQYLRWRIADGPEWRMEADALLLTTFSSTLSLERTRFTRDWISRRMDVIAINNSLVVATVLAVGPFTYILIRSGQWSGPLVRWVALLVAFVLAGGFVTSSRILHKQVVRAVRGILAKA